MSSSKKAIQSQRRGSPAKEAKTASPNLRRAVELAMRLMKIPGPSGKEARVADYIVGQLVRAGAPASAIRTDKAHQRTPYKGNIGNLVLQLPGRIRGPRRLFSAHLDTVPICVGAKPVRRGALIVSADPATGLGADDRAGSAVLLTTALELLQRDLPHPPLTFCWFVQEETGLHGARCMSKSLLGKPQLAFNWDGGSPAKLTIGATGGYRLQIDIGGIASHAGGAPERGVSAITIASLAISDLQRTGWHGRIVRGRNEGTSNFGVIQGGVATNVVPDSARIQAEARSHDARFRGQIVKRIEEAFRQAARKLTNDQGQSGTVKIRGRLDYEAFRLATDEPSVLAAEAGVRSIGREPLRAIANGGLDANWLTAHGFPSVTLGCGQLNQHTHGEALDIANYQDACRIALHLATGRESP